MNGRWKRIDTLLLVALLSLATLRSLVWISTYPILKISDETSHFDNIQFRAEHGLRRPNQGTAPIDKVIGHGASMELRRTWAATNLYFRTKFLRARHWVPEEKELQERALTRDDANTDGQNASIGYPGFYYNLAAIPYRMLRKKSVLVRMFAIRALSMLFGLLLVGCTFAAARLAIDSRPLAFAAALFTTLQPMAAQQTIAMNNDAAVLGLCALAFLLQLLILEGNRASLFLWLGLALTMALAVETKPHALALLPGCLLCGAFELRRAPRERATWIALGAALGLYAFVRVVFPHIFDRPWHSGPTPHASVPVLHETPDAPVGGFLSFVLFDIDSSYFDFLVATGWGSFCWLDFGLSSEWFADLRFAAPLFWLGAAAAIARRSLAPDDSFFWRLRPAVLAAVTAVVGFVFVLYAEYVAETSMHLRNAIQGRALLVVLPAISILGATALGSLVPRRYHTLLAAICVLCMTLLATCALVQVVSYEYVD